MKSLILKALVGLVLFVGSLVGALAATGRLNHEGTANIPGLSALFPAPPAPPAEAGAAGHEGKDGQPADATHSGEATPTDAAQHGAEPGAEPQEPQGAGPHKQKVGRSIVEPEVKAGGEHGGGGEEGGGHEAEKEKKPAKKPAEHGAPMAGEGKAEGANPAKDFDHLQQSLANEGKSKYTPGEYFKFDGMPSGLTAEQINEAWQRVQGVLADIERRKTSLDLREQELQELADDISRRQGELGKERTEIEQEHRRLDGRIQKFQEQVKLVRSDEAAALKRNAATMASFEPSKAAELVQEQWKSDKGQDEVLRLFEFMDKDSVNEVLKALPTPIVQDLMKKRLRVSKEAAPAGPAK